MGLAYDISNDFQASLTYRLAYNPASKSVTINTNFFADNYVAGPPSPFPWPTRADGTVTLKKDWFLDHTIAFGLKYFI